MQIWILSASPAEAGSSFVFRYSRTASTVVKSIGFGASVLRFGYVRGRALTAGFSRISATDLSWRRRREFSYRGILFRYQPNEDVIARAIRGGRCDRDGVRGRGFKISA